MANELKFYGNFDSTQIERQTKKMAQNLDAAFGKDGVNVVSRDTIKFLKDESKNAIQALRNETRGLEGEFRKITKEMQLQDQSSEKQKSQAQYRMKVSEQILSNAKKTRALELVEKRLANQGRPIIDVPHRNISQRRRGLLGRVGGALSPIASATPGFGNVAAGAVGRGVGAAAGMGAIGGLALGGLGAAAGLAAAGMMRLAGAAKRYEAAVPQLLKINALGQTEYKGIGRQTAKQMGFGPEETYKLQESIAKAFGPKNQRQAEAMGGNMMTFGRQYGMDPSQLAGMGNRLRQTGGTASSQKSMALMMGKATASAIDKSQVGHYMEATTNLLSELNAGGNLATTAMIGVMAKMTAAGTSPEQTAKQISDINQGIAGSTGESRTFLTEAFIKAGVGGNTLMGAQTAVDTGLMGVNLEQLTAGMEAGGARDKAVRAEFEGLSGAGATKKKAKGILGLLNNRTQNLGQMGRGAELARMLGIKGGAVGGVKAETLLQQMADSNGASLEKQREMLKSLTEDPSSAWRTKVQEHLGSIDSNLRIAQKKTAIDQAAMSQGKGFIGYAQALDDLMTGLSSSTLAVITAFDRLSKEYMPPIMEAFKKVADLLGISSESSTPSVVEALKDVSGFEKSKRKYGIGQFGGISEPEAILAKKHTTRGTRTQAQQDFGSGNLSFAALAEFKELRGQHKKGGKVDPELVRLFNSAQEIGGGDQLTMEKMLIELQRLNGSIVRKSQIEGPSTTSTGPLGG